MVVEAVGHRDGHAEAAGGLQQPAKKTRSGKHKAGSRPWKDRVKKEIAKEITKDRAVIVDEQQLESLRRELKELREELAYERKWRIHWEGIARPPVWKRGC